MTLNKRLSNGRTPAEGTSVIAALLLTLLSVQAQSVERVVHYHNDALGSPIAATDEQGRVVWRKSYTPYGQPIDPAAPNEPGYTGKFEEPDLGIQNFGARWYDPRIGRFLAIDPAGFDPQNPQSFNRYAYANNNPYKYVDPDGRAAETALDVVSLGLSANAFRNDPSLANGLGLAYDTRIFRIQTFKHIRSSKTHSGGRRVCCALV